MNLDLLLEAFGAILEPATLAAILIGVLIGQLVGILPGISSPAALAILLPTSYAFGPVAGIAMLSGMWLGSSYSGIITSVLLNIPGEGDSVIATLDGHQMARKGRGELALGVSAFGGFFAATVALIILQLVGPSIAGFALLFGPPQLFALMAFGLSLVAWLAGASIVKGLISTVLGLLIGTVGSDLVSGESRLTFGFAEMLNGIDFVVVVVGLFGLAEVFYTVGQTIHADTRVKFAFRNLFPRAGEWRPSIGASLRGTGVGFVTGLIPGVGPTNATFLSYALEKKLAKDPERFGKGAIEGVAAPGAAGHAATVGGLIPLLALGVPASATAAILVGGFVIHGLFPGPLLYAQHPEVVWGLIASLYLANVLLVLMNTLFIPAMVKIVDVAEPYLAPLVGVLTMIGAFSISNNILHMWMALAFGFVGYAFRRLDIPVAPMVIALVLGAKAETSLRQSLVISNGNPLIFISTPISAVLLGAAILVLFGPLLTRLWNPFRRTAVGMPSD